MSPVIRIESFPEENGPQIAGLITQYTGMHAVDELLTKLPVEIEVEGESFEPLKNQLEQLGCNQKVVSLDVLAEELLSPEDQKILVAPAARARSHLGSDIEDGLGRGVRRRGEPSLVDLLPQPKLTLEAGQILRLAERGRVRARGRCA